MTKTFNFHDKLAEGKAGENYLLRNSPWIEATDGRKSDFKIIGSQDHGEIKTDSYCPTGEHKKKTENFFMERWGNDSTHAPGGPWRSQEYRVRYFVYYYPCCGTYFVFDTEILVARLEKLIRGRKCTKKVIRNKTGNNTWNTIGYTVPINLLENISQVYKA